MVTQIATLLGLLGILILLASVYVIVEERERITFVIGIVLIIFTPLVLTGLGVPQFVNTGIVLGGFLLVAVSLVPLLR